MPEKCMSDETGSILQTSVALLIQINFLEASPDEWNPLKKHSLCLQATTNANICLTGGHTQDQKRILGF